MSFAPQAGDKNSGAISDLSVDGMHGDMRNLWFCGWFISVELQGISPVDFWAAFYSETRCLAPPACDCPHFSSPPQRDLS
jgi:hypothetical protein